MTPAARIQARIDILDLVAAGDRPADRVLDAFTRARRYMGSKDRRAVAEGVYEVLRRRARLSWWCARVDGVSGEPVGRDLAIAASAMELGAERTRLLFDGTQYGPAPLDDREWALARSLSGQDLDHADQERAARLELPAWLAPKLTEAFGSELEAEMTALNAVAPLDLRVNALKSDRDSVRAAMAQAGMDTASIPFLPLGLRAGRQMAVKNTPAYRDGLVEIQDAGSQIAALMCDARPAMAVVDFCAGAGGKSLALAASMNNQGVLIALDVDQARLDRAAGRLRRAGADLAERRVLKGEAWLRVQAGKYDRVLVDAPCSGSGAWRRDPHARWQLTPERLAGYRDAQARSLDKAATLVRPGGRLIYVTCSVLPEENEHQIEAFSHGRDGFSLLPAAQVWAEALGSENPGPETFRESCLRLTPARHGTDGFFVAVLERGAER